MRETLNEGFTELKKAREIHGVSQTMLSALSGVDQANISNYEKGVHSPTLRIMRRLADAMGMELYIEFKEKKDDSDERRHY